MKDDIHIGRLHDGNRWVVALYRVRRTRMQWVAFDIPMRLHTTPALEARYIREIDDPPPVKRTARKMLRQAKRFLATKGAREFLKEVISK